MNLERFTFSRAKRTRRMAMVLLVIAALIGVVD
jgi:hypothetical protein